MSTQVPSEIQVLRKGEFPHRISGIIQVIDDFAINEMVARFRAENRQPGILLDYDHFSYNPSQRSTAAGWITALMPRSDGLWATVNWSNSGSNSVAGQDYKFVSPTWLPTDIQQLGNNRARPLRIDRVALTNDPNIWGCAPITNRRSGPAGMGSDRDLALRQFLAITNRAKQEKGWSFDQAWKSTANHFPALYKMASLSNRNSYWDCEDIPDLVKAHEGEVILKLHQDVRDKLDNDENPANCVPMTAKPDGMYQEIKSRIRTLMAQTPGLSIAEAIKQVKATAPDYWAVMVAAQGALAH